MEENKNSTGNERVSGRVSKKVKHIDSPIRSGIYCDFCGAKKILYRLNKALVCFNCKRLHTTNLDKPSQYIKTTKATLEDFESGGVSEHQHADYVKRVGKGWKMGPLGK